MDDEDVGGSLLWWARKTMMAGVTSASLSWKEGAWGSGLDGKTGVEYGAVLRAIYQTSRKLHGSNRSTSGLPNSSAQYRCPSSMQPTLQSNAPFSIQMLQTTVQNALLSQIAVASCCHHARLQLL